jgi:hypothetical protein
MPNLTLNLVLVGSDAFSAADRQKVNDAVQIMRTIYAAVDLHFSIDRFKMSVADAGPLVTVKSNADARALTEKVAGPVNTVDIFVVRSMLGADGWSPVGGPCDKRKKGMTGCVVSLNGSAANCGNSFAHELGHYLGLAHCPCSDPACTSNFIRGTGGCSSNSNTDITAQQGAIVTGHCAVTP